VVGRGYPPTPLRRRGWSSTLRQQVRSPVASVCRHHRRQLRAAVRRTSDLPARLPRRTEWGLGMPIQNSSPGSVFALPVLPNTSTRAVSPVRPLTLGSSSPSPGSPLHTASGRRVFLVGWPQPTQSDPSCLRRTKDTWLSTTVARGDHPSPTCRLKLSFASQARQPAIPAWPAADDPHIPLPRLAGTGRRRACVGLPAGAMSPGMKPFAGWRRQATTSAGASVGSAGGVAERDSVPDHQRFEECRLSRDPEAESGERPARAVAGDGGQDFDPAAHEIGRSVRASRWRADERCRPRVQAAALPAGPASDTPPQHRCSGVGRQPPVSGCSHSPCGLPCVRRSDLVR